MSEYPVPQFIESESKIIFFLTFRQFFIIVGGGALCFASYLTLPFIFFVIISVVITLIVIVVAFIKINNESVVKILLNFIGFSFGSKNYTWQKDGLGQTNQEIGNSKDRNFSYVEPDFKTQEYTKKPSAFEIGNNKLKSTKKTIELRGGDNLEIK